MWCQYSHDRNFPYDLAREFTTKASLLACVRFFFIKKRFLFRSESAAYFRLEVYVDNFPEAISLLTRYRSLVRFRALLDFYQEKAVENHDLPF